MKNAAIFAKRGLLLLTYNKGGPKMELVSLFMLVGCLLYRKKNPFYFRRYFKQLNTTFVPEVGKDVYIKSTALSIQGTDLSGKIENKI